MVTLHHSHARFDIAGEEVWTVLSLVKAGVYVQ